LPAIDGGQRNRNLRFLAGTIFGLAGSRILQGPLHNGSILTYGLGTAGAFFVLRNHAEGYSRRNSSTFGTFERPVTCWPSAVSADHNVAADSLRWSHSTSDLNQRRVSEPKLLDPKPELPDDTLISDVELPARIRDLLEAAGLITVGEVREISDETLLSFQDFGKTSLAHLRETLGLPSCDGVRPPGGKNLR
jgi:hypothetical protein